MKANGSEGILTVKANGSEGILTNTPFLSESLGLLGRRAAFTLTGAYVVGIRQISLDVYSYEILP